MVAFYTLRRQVFSMDQILYFAPPNIVYSSDESKSSDELKSKSGALAHAQNLAA
jgi:hypothetical protein